MLLRYLNEILDVIDEIKLKQVVFTQHFFVEACYYYNDAISNSLKMIKDELKEHPDHIKSYSDIDLKLLLDQIHQLRRDFEFEEKARNKIKDESNDVSENYKNSFQSFQVKAEQTMNEIEVCVLNFQLDIKITYSVDNYYAFEDFLDQLQNDLPEELDCFEPIKEENNDLLECYYRKTSIKALENQKTKKPTFMQNLIAKRFWLDNFGEIHNVEFIDFFEKFKNYVFETEKTNIDEAYAETLRKHLDVSKNLKVYSKGFDLFFTNLWSNFDFRKSFLAANEISPSHPTKLPSLRLNCIFVKEEEKNASKPVSPAKAGDISPDFSPKIKFFQNSFNTSISTEAFLDNDSQKQIKDITKHPLVFGRKTRAFTPDIQLFGLNISNKHFQISAYNKHKCDELNGYYIADLSLTNRTCLEVLEHQSYILDKGSLIEICSRVFCVSELYPRHNVEEEVAEKDWFHVPTHIPKSKEEINLEEIVKTPDPFIKLNDIDEDTIDLDDKKPYRNKEIYLDEKGEVKDVVVKDVVNGKEKKEEQKENKDKLSAIIKFENEKWVLKKAKNSEQNVLIYLINKDELLGKQISFGCKLKNNMMINCNSHTLEVVLT